jgi:glycolate oxidase FAD binding subunit
MTSTFGAAPDSLEPNSLEVLPNSQAELQKFLTENFAGPKRGLTTVGGRTALEFGGPLSKPAQTIDITRLNRVVDFPARDMTITVEAGITIDRATEVLKVEGQRLPIDVAQSNRATLGGAVATNTFGPRRFGYGTFRDYVIGVTAITAEGREFHSGGRVVKNVAGYDLCKLLVGSLGTLAVITQLTLKLKPIAESSALVCASFEKSDDRDAAVADLLLSETRPVAIETLNAPAAALVEAGAQVGLPIDHSLLLVGLEGSVAETEWQTSALTQELGKRHPKEMSIAGGTNADRLWRALTEFPVGTAGTRVFQASLLPSRVAHFDEQASRLGAAILCHAGDGVVVGRLTASEIPGQGPEIVSSLVDAAGKCGGSLISLSGDSSWEQSASIRGTASAWLLMRKLKQSFDPADLLNPGRLFSAAGST